MLRLQDMTLVQRSRIKKFVKKYNSERTKSFYSHMYSRQRLLSTDTDFYNAYLNIVKRTAAFFKDLGCTNPITASIVFEYALWNGYFSKDNHLVYCSAGRVNNMAIPGADIMLGKSVCLNNAEMLTRVLREMGMEAYLVGAAIFPKKNQQREYRPNINREVIEEKPSFVKKYLLRPIVKKIGNHAVTLIKDGDYYMLCDPTGLAFAEIHDVMKAKYIGMKTKIALKPAIGLAFNEGDKQKYIDSLLKAFVLSDHKQITTEQVKGFYDPMIEICDNNKHVFEEFHEANKEDIDVVCKKLTKPFI